MIIGVDPGKGGAAVLLSPKGYLMDFCDFISVKTGKKNELAVALIANYIVNKWLHPDEVPSPEVVVYIELVGVMPKQGIVSAFDFGFSTGVMHGIFAAHGCRIEMIRPQAWKKPLGLLKTEKDATRLWAQRRWPNQSNTWFKRKLDIGRADAAAIAVAGQLIEQKGHDLA